jgi:hypothetical protein
MDTKEIWLQKTKPLYRGVLVFSIAGMLYGFIGLSSAEAKMAIFEILFKGGDIFSDPSAYLINSRILLIAVAVGYFLFWRAMNEFTGILNEQDSLQMKKIGMGALLIIAASVLSCIPNSFVGDLVADLAGIGASIIMMQAYFALNKSQTFPQQSGIAAKRLAIAHVLLAAWYLTELILFLVFSSDPKKDVKSTVEMIMFIKLVLPIVAYIMIIIGWKKIKTTDPQNYLESSINT